MERVVSGVPVRGLDVDAETRCAHYASERDVVAIRAACCGAYYACRTCHDALCDHDHRVVPRGDFDDPAVLCGACGATLTVREYADCGDACPVCGRAFNPGCHPATGTGTSPRGNVENTCNGGECDERSQRIRAVTCGGTGGDALGKTRSVPVALGLRLGHHVGESEIRSL